MIKSKETYAIYRQLKYTTNRISDNFYKEHISLAIIYTRNKSIYQCLWFLNKTNSLSLWQYFLDAFFVLPANLWRHASAVQLINQRGLLTSLSPPLLQVSYAPPLFPHRRSPSPTAFGGFLIYFGWFLRFMHFSCSPSVLACFCLLPFCSLFARLLHPCRLLCFALCALLAIKFDTHLFGQ